MAKGLKVEGAAELRRAFRDVAGKDGERRLRQASKEVSTRAAADARSAAQGGTPLQRKVAAAIRPRGNINRGAGIAITRTGKSPAAGVAFWGIDNAIGWFANEDRFGPAEGRGAAQKLPPHVGNTWTAATRGEGPHRINDALADHVDEYAALMEDAVYRAAADVGFDVK